MATAASSAAFPTVPSVAAPPPKSFFDDLPAGSAITANVNYACYPTNEVVEFSSVEGNDEELVLCLFRRRAN